MHEAGAVARAFADRPATLAGSSGGSSAPSRVRVIIRDPTRAHPDAVRLYAEEHLRESGVALPEVIVELLSIACAECGTAGHPSPMDPVCARCGSPYPPVPGPAIVVGEA